MPSKSLLSVLNDDSAGHSVTNESELEGAVNECFTIDSVNDDDHIDTELQNSQKSIFKEHLKLKCSMLDFDTF